MFRFVRITRTLALMVAASSMSTASAYAEPLRLASDVWPPFTGTEDEPRVAIELVNEALKRAGVASTIQMLEVGALTPALKAQRFDGTAAIWRSTAREKYLRFSKPYLENRLVLVGRKGSDVSATRLAQLKGKRVAIVKAFAYGEALEQAPGTIFVRGQSDQDNLKRLLSGTVDYVLVDDLLAYHLMIDYAAETKRLLQVGSIPLLTRSLHFAVHRARPDGAKIIGRFNAEIDKMMADGTIHRILEVGWIRADVDGDGQTEMVLGGKRAGKAPPARTYDWPTVRRNRPGPERKSRIWIEGITYENWDQVPPRYKVEPEPLVPQRKGGIRFRFDVRL